MPINKGGNRTKKQKRNFGKYNAIDRIKNGQMFGKIDHNNGDHFVVLCSDNIKRIAGLTNTIRKGPRLHKDTYVVVTPNDKGGCSIEGIGNPPNDIIKLFKSNDPKGDMGIEFYDSDDNEDALIKNKNKENKNEIDIMNLPPNDDEDNEFDDFYGNNENNDNLLIKNNNNENNDDNYDFLLKNKKSNLKNTSNNSKKNIIDKILDGDSDDDLDNL